MNMKLKTLSITLMLSLFLSTTVLAATPVENFVINLRNTGLPLILLWLLTLAIIFGILSHVNTPKSIAGRGVIAIAAAFLVLLAAAGTQTVTFISNLLTSAIVIIVGLLAAVIFLELTGTKVGDKHIFAAHPKFFGAAILILVILIFIGAGGLGLLNIPAITITEPVIAILFFLVVMVAAIWVLLKESKG